MANNLSWIYSLTAFTIVKWFLVVGLVMYTAFAIIIVKQVRVMSEAIEDGFNGLISLFSWVHLAVAILLIVLAVVVL